MSILKIENMSAGYWGTKVLQNISLSIEQGEILALVGESGSGKSTVIKSVMGLKSSHVKVSSGKIIFNGNDMLSLKQEERRRLLGNDLCTVFQNPQTSMNPIRKIKKQFLETIKSHKDVSDAEALRLIKDCFYKLGLSDADRILESCPFELSGGMCQRVAIALAMVMEPKLILADEPTSALDVVSQLQVVEELLLLKKNFKVAVLLVTHNIAVAEKVADKIAIMHAGKIVEFGDTGVVLGQPKNDYTKSLLADVPRIEAGQREREKTETLLEANSIIKQYKVGDRKVDAVSGISFELEKGEILGIVGESGSGKSTLARQLIRLETPNEGSIRIGTKNIADYKKKELLCLYTKAQMVFQNPVSSFDPRKTIRSSIKDAIKNLAGIRQSDEIDKRINALMIRVGLNTELADRYPFQLSGGQCQRSAIARAIACDPQLLICDEATSALDVTVQAGIVELLRSLVKSNNMSIIFISHDIALVSGFCDRIMVMKNGKCVEYGPSSKVIKAPENEYTKTLIKAASIKGESSI